MNRRPPQCRHCLIWFGRDGVVTIGCAHCHYVSARYEESDETLLARQVRSSREQHEEQCGRLRRAA